MAKKLPLALALALFGSSAALAADQPSGFDMILARQAGQDLVAGDFVGLLQAAKNKLPDVKPFANAAGGIARWESVFVLMFPEGTEQGHKTRALPAIWTNRAGFETAAHNLAEAATKVQAAAKAGDQAAFAQDVQALGDACNDCHKQFRAK